MQECKITMFADDMSIYHENDLSLSSQSQQLDINDAMKWFYANKLTINATKCEMVSYGLRKHPSFCMN